MFCQPQPKLCVFTRQNGKYLKGYLVVFNKHYDHDDDDEHTAKRTKSIWSCALLNETAYDYKNNPHPRSIKLMFKEHARNTLATRMGGVCVKLDGVQKDKFDDTRHVMFLWGVPTPEQIAPGLNVPGGPTGPNAIG